MNHPEWKPMIVTPPHPEYPAAHATVSMAAATILTTILGNNVSFTDNTYRYRGFKSHHFNNLIDAAKEAGLSRFYGGIHYKKSIEAGYTEGKDVAGYIAKKLVFRN
jgi:L-amino acid N-acyltransferase YncA